MGVQNSNAEASYNENQTDGDSGFSKEVSGEEKHFIIEKEVSRTEKGSPGRSEWLLRF